MLNCQDALAKYCNVTSLPNSTERQARPLVKKLTDCSLQIQHPVVEGTSSSAPGSPPGCGCSLLQLRGGLEPQRCVRPRKQRGVATHGSPRTPSPAPLPRALEAVHSWTRRRQMGGLCSCGRPSSRGRRAPLSSFAHSSWAHGSPPAPPARAALSAGGPARFHCACCAKPARSQPCPMGPGGWWQPRCPPPVPFAHPAVPPGSCWAPGAWPRCPAPRPEPFLLQQAGRGTLGSRHLTHLHSALQTRNGHFLLLNALQIAWENDEVYNQNI